MKTALTGSVLVHMAALAWGVVSLASPKPLEVAEVEALPIDIVPIEEITRSIQGDRKADPSDTPAPKPTTAAPTPKPAENVGDTQNDVKADAPKAEKAPAVEKTQAPTPPPPPVEKATPVPTPTAEPEPEPKPKTDIALLLKQSDTPLTDETVEESFEKLPEKVAVPKKRPTPPKPDSTATNQRSEDTKKKEDAPKKVVQNKADANAGGAKRSTKEAALGTKKTNSAGKLSQTELDALRGALEGCFNAGDLPGHKDAATMRARVTFKLTRSGDVDGRIRTKVSGTSGTTRAVFSRRVTNAILDCAPFSLPPEKYDTWSDVVVNFSLKDLL